MSDDYRDEPDRREEDERKTIGEQRHASEDEIRQVEREEREDDDE